MFQLLSTILSILLRPLPILLILGVISFIIYRDYCRKKHLDPAKTNYKILALSIGLTLLTAIILFFLFILMAAHLGIPFM